MAKFGKAQLKNETPQWAKWMFRVTLVLTTAISIWVAGTNLIDDSIKYEIILLLKCIDPVVMGFSKLFGVDVIKREQE